MECPLLAFCDELVMCILCVHVGVIEKEVNCTIGHLFFLSIFIYLFIGLHWVLVADLTVSAHGI